MRASEVPGWMAKAGPISSWINTGLIILTLVAGGIYWITTKDNNDAASSGQLAAAQKQISDLVNKVEEGKAAQVKVAEDQKKVQADALDKLTKDLTGQISDVKAKQDVTAGQLQTIQVTNQGFVGQFALIDQRLLQITRQQDNVEVRTTSLEI